MTCIAADHDICQPLSYHHHCAIFLRDTNAGINLTSYHPPPGTPGLLHRNVCPAPGLLHNRKCPGGGPKNDDVPGAGHLHQLAFKHENC